MKEWVSIYETNKCDIGTPNIYRFPQVSGTEGVQNGVSSDVYEGKREEKKKVKKKGRKERKKKEREEEKKKGIK